VDGRQGDRLVTVAELLPEGQLELNDQLYMPDSKGALVPIELVKPADKLRDQLVRELAASAEAASKSLAEFKAKAFADVDAFLAMVAEKYGAKAVPGGEKGNVTLLSYDGRVRIQVQVADVTSFKSEELQACKSIIDALIAEWSADSQAEIRAIVMNAFRVDNAGQINRGALLGLRRLDIQDPRWAEAMKALNDSISVDGTKPYIRFARRSATDKAWENISLDIATA
jgi:hypothetical protein